MSKFRTRSMSVQRGIEQLGITTLWGLMGNETNMTRPEGLKVKVKNEGYLEPYLQLISVLLFVYHIYI